MLRIPVSDNSSSRILKECYWLPKFASQINIQISTPLALGYVTDNNSWYCSVHKWIDGETAIKSRIGDGCQFAIDIATFIGELQKIDTNEAPLSGKHNEFRGASLELLDVITRNAITSLQDYFDSAKLLLIWESALYASFCHDKLVWVHGDLQSGNILVKNGKLNAVIDFGLMGVGDSACDLMVNWTMLNSKSRITFRNTLAIDDDSWRRGRGWVLYFGVIGFAYYIDKNPTLAQICENTINEVVFDYNCEK